MNTREETKLRNWVRLRGKESITVLDVLKGQRKAFHMVFALLLGMGVYSLFCFGLYSFPFGAFLGGIASLLGLLSRSRKSVAIELRYIDWAKVEQALNANHT